MCISVWMLWCDWYGGIMFLLACVHVWHNTHVTVQLAPDVWWTSPQCQVLTVSALC